MPENDVNALIQQADALLEKGLVQQAAGLYSKACQLDPSASDAWLMLGMIHGDAGNFGEAIRHLQKCLEMAPSTPDAHYSLARIYLAQHKEDEAYFHAKEATRDDTYADAWLLRAVLSAKRGVYVESELCAVKVIELDRDNVEGNVNLAHAQGKLDKLPEAKETLETVLRMAPNRADAIHMYAHICEQLGESQNAADAYQRLAGIRGMEHVGQVGLAKIFSAAGNVDKAMSCIQLALKHKPDFGDAVFHLAQLHHLLGHQEEALPLYEKAATLLADNSFVLERQADAREELGDLEGALDLYGRSLARKESTSALIKRALAVPVIMESAEQIKLVREALLRNLDDLKDRRLRIDDPAQTIAKLPFYTVYHGLNDLPMNQALADFYLQSSPSLSYTAGHIGAARKGQGKIRIGLISRFFCTHTIGQVMHDIIQKLSRDRFEVLLFTFPYAKDAFAAKINASADRVFFLPQDWSRAHELIAEQKLDILFYTDIGMEPYTYFLAYARLAPVQCTTWGHAVTTGIPNIDYYLTGDSFEPAGAEGHYSEKLVRLSGAPTHYPMPRLPGGNSTEEFGWDTRKNTYLCPQVLYKFHPEFDAMLAGILREDPEGEVVLLECRHPSWLNLLRQRFTKSMPDVAGRIRVLPYPGPEGYLRMLQACDVMLDTYHYGGGSTSLQGLGLGTPIVTLPGEFQRGRHTYSYYRTIGMTDCVAKNKEDYVNISVRLGRDKAYRAHVSEQIRQKSAPLFSDFNVIREMEDFFVASLEKNAPLS